MNKISIGIFLSLLLMMSVAQAGFWGDSWNFMITGAVVAEEGSVSISEEGSGEIPSEPVPMEPVQEDPNEGSSGEEPKDPYENKEYTQESYT